MPPLYATENQKDPMVICKFFCGSWTWWATEFDGKDTFFGYVDGLEAELGYFSLSELEQVKVNAPFRIIIDGKEHLSAYPILVERDLYFKPRRLSVIKAEVRKRRAGL